MFPLNWLTPIIRTDGTRSTLGDEFDAIKKESEDASNDTVTFTSSDVVDADATSWTSVTPILTGSKIKDLMESMSKMFKNIRFLYKMLGTSDISQVSESGTVTGGLVALHSNLNSPIIRSGTGQIMTGAEGFSAIGEYTVSLFPDHSLRIDFACKVESSIAQAGYYGGVDKTIFETVTEKTITPLVGGSVVYYTSGREYATENDYGGTWAIQTENPNLWIPSRVYTTGGSIGTWALNHWSAGCSFHGFVIGRWND